jgi:hypothetical protein
MGPLDGAIAPTTALKEGGRRCGVGDGYAGSSVPNRRVLVLDEYWPTKVLGTRVLLVEYSLVSTMKSDIVVAPFILLHRRRYRFPWC